MKKSSYKPDNVDDNISPTPRLDEFLKNHFEELEKDIDWDDLDIRKSIYKQIEAILRRKKKIQ